MYRLIKNQFTDKVDVVKRLSDGAFIPFDPANTDYANFKSQINADEAQLEDAEGVLMTNEQAVEFVKTLP